jgi:hypothetical protein
MVHVAGQSRGSPIRSIFSDKAGKGRRNRANVQTFALLQGEEGTFPSGGGKCLGEQGKGQAFRADLAQFRALANTAARTGIADLGWHKACKFMWCIPAGARATNRWNW